MNRKCKLCNRPYWERGVEPLLADDRFCTVCAIESCERELEELEAISGRIQCPTEFRPLFDGGGVE